jgi:pyridoxamine 5'-phosphate oxidase family protein
MGEPTRAGFTNAELDYLQGERRLGRLATVDETGRPHVVPVGMWRYNAELGAIDVGGHDLARTRKYRNVAANHRAALVIDDLASTDPWRPRAVLVQGSAHVVPGQQLIRIVPESVVSWGLD